MQATKDRKESLGNAVTFRTIYDAAEFCECAAVGLGYVLDFGEFSLKHWLSVADHCTRYINGVRTFCASCEDLHYWAIRA